MRNANRVNKTDKKHEMHGGASTREYNSWCHMKRRCLNPNSPRFQYYGKRGITICDAWLHSFGTFRQDMGACPPRHSLHRIDNNGPYSPENCCWATDKTQANNKQTSRLITANGETHTLAEWANIGHVTRGALKVRLSYGWTPEKAIFTPVKELSRDPLTFNGKTQSVSAWARELGISQSLLWLRLQAWSIEEALTRPVRENAHLITFNGKTQNLTEWSQELGIKYATLQARLNRGWPLEKVLSPHKK